MISEENVQNFLKKAGNLGFWGLKKSQNWQYSKKTSGAAKQAFGSVEGAKCIFLISTFRKSNFLLPSEISGAWQQIL